MNVATWREAVESQKGRMWVEAGQGPRVCMLYQPPRNVARIDRRGRKKVKSRSKMDSEEVTFWEVSLETAMRSEFRGQCSHMMRR